MMHVDWLPSASLKHSQILCACNACLLKKRLRLEKFHTDNIVIIPKLILELVIHSTMMPRKSTKVDIS